VIHRDIKPANILIAHDGTVKITDFGIARTTDTTRLTNTGHSVGTLAYMSPEQVRGDVVDARSDVYSVGLTFYEMVTGCRAMQGDTAHSLMNAQLWVMPAEPVHVNPSVPRWISAAIMRALAKQPDQRFQSAAAFKAVLTNDDPTVVAAEPRTPMPSVIAPTVAAPAAAGPSAFPAPPATGPAASAIHGSSPSGSQAGSQPGSQPGTFDPVILDRLAQALAPYLGPIAKVLVTRAARRARNLHDLYEALAAEIPSEDDRRRFLGRVRSAL
jgi:serine/threonine protein kinase